MKSPIIVVCALIKETQVADLTNTAIQYEVVMFNDLKDEDLQRIEIVYGWNKTMSQYYSEGNLPNLSWIQKETAGLDAIPEEIRTNERILLSSAKGIHAKPITENVFGYILSVSRGIFQALSKQVDHDWNRSNLNDIVSLKDKTILIYGTGNIGQEIARTAKFFEMNTIGVNTDGRTVDYFDQTMTLVEAPEVVNKVHFIVNSFPSTEQSRGLFNEAFFNQLSPQAHFINIGRGDAVVETELEKALTSQNLAGAYLDVTGKEPLPADSLLWDTPNVVITPHISGTVEHFRDSIYPIFRKNLTTYLDDKTLVINEYSSRKGY